MHEQSLSSISFVISAAYTFTFANAIFFMVAIDPTQSFGIENIEFNIERVMCAIVCMVMTLRFFFGNNQYIYEVMSSSRSPWVKFYQFFFIAIQSVVLMISSYFIANTELFVWTITALFAVELFWYLLTFFIDREGVWPATSKDERYKFLTAELINLIFLLGVFYISYLTPDRSIKWLTWIFLLFAFNTIYDLKKNMQSYMGG